MTTEDAAAPPQQPPGIVDAYTHFAPVSLLSFLEKHSQGPLVFAKLFGRIPTLTDEMARLTAMDELGIQTHVLVPLPWLETVPAVHKDPQLALEACRLCNDELSSLSSRHPGRFLGVGLLPTGHMDDPTIITTAFHHAITTAGLLGVAVFIGPTATPLDHPGFDTLYRLAEEHDVPIWLHPNRPQFVADLDAYSSKGSMHQIWNTLGWVYDTSVAMVHLCLSGVFRRYPKLKVVTHHHGGLIPFFTDRFIVQSQNFDDTEQLDLLKDLRLFYCDTATFGDQPLNIRQALDFFGHDRVLFGTDSPMDMANPGFFTKASRASIDKCPGIMDGCGDGGDGSGDGGVVKDKVMGRNFWNMVGRRWWTTTATTTTQTPPS